MPWSRTTAERYSELGKQQHIAILGPEIEELLSPLDGLRVLDFGCGEGRLTRRLVSAGAAEVVGLDENRRMIASARHVLGDLPAHLRRRVRLEVGDEGRIAREGDFDAVVCSLALMMCATRQRLQRTAAALLGALSPVGRLLVIITHPCFRGGGWSTFHYEMPPDFDYWSSGEPYEVIITPPEGARAVTITDYHWMLQDYVSALADGGGSVTALRELPAERREDGRPLGPPAYLCLLVRADPRHP